MHVWYTTNLMFLQVIVFHMLHHLPKYIHMFGPVWTHWMFVFERFNHVLTENIASKRTPELSAVKRLEVSVYKLT